ncbi:MAG TPA: methylated-DNA--[protein]-cysteine S-methyltransferase [Streptosporangiaceae bacterium]|nr:methylated-DNA--[protein]-cysteine S-methyltransferase [Streptosporangiaceae bacterium]
MTHAVMDSPLGELTLVGNDGALAGLYFSGQRNRPRPPRLGRPDPAGLAEPVRQLGEYFAGERTAFELDLDLHGSAFDRQVWALVAAIPYGQTRSYGQLARELGDPGLAQEVGVSNARNRLCIVVPCHRVVGADGNLTGYAGGLARKRALLELEAAAEPAGRLF